MKFDPIDTISKAAADLAESSGLRTGSSLVVERVCRSLGGQSAFVALGRNAILLFVLSGLMAKTFIYLKWPDGSRSLGSWIYTSAFMPLAPPYVASLAYAVANLALLYALLAYLHRRKMYLTV